MTRVFCFCSIAFLASHVPVHAQPKGPPRYYTNSLGMKFVWIEPGSFLMGSPKDEKDRHVAEVQHTVELTKGFWMGVCPVTQEQWRAVISDRAFVRPTEGFDLSNPSLFHGDKKLPVESVTWDDCQTFLKKLRAKDRQSYRLPTEAEWEYACRAGTTTPFYCGDTLTTALANFSDGSIKPGGKKGPARPKTRPVGSFPPNAWGLLRHARQRGPMVPGSVRPLPATRCGRSAGTEPGRQPCAARRFVGGLRGSLPVGQPGLGRESRQGHLRFTRLLLRGMTGS